MYNVTRKLPSETEFSFVGQGGSSNKALTDQTLPAGSTYASYRVQGFYGPHIGQESITFIIYFGTSQQPQSQAA